MLQIKNTKGVRDPWKLPLFPQGKSLARLTGDPAGPCAPSEPGSPLVPLRPGKPLTPCGPGRPGSPRGPVLVTPPSQVQKPKSPRGKTDNVKQSRPSFARKKKTDNSYLWLWGNQEAWREETQMNTFRVCLWEVWCKVQLSVCLMCSWGTSVTYT